METRQRGEPGTSIGPETRLILTELQQLQQMVLNLSNEVRDLRKDNQKIKGLTANCFTNQKNLYSKLVEDMTELKHALTIDQANFNHYISNTNQLEEPNKNFAQNEADFTNLPISPDSEFLIDEPDLKRIKMEMEMENFGSDSSETFNQEPDVSQVPLLELYKQELEPIDEPSHSETRMSAERAEYRDKQIKNHPNPVPINCFSTLNPERLSKLQGKRTYVVPRIDEPTEMIDLAQVMLKIVRKHSTAMVKPAIFFRRIIRTILFQLSGCKEQIFILLACGRRLVSRGRTGTTAKTEDLIFISDSLLNKIVEICVHMVADPNEKDKDPFRYNCKIEYAEAEITRLFKNVVKDCRRGRFTKALESGLDDHEAVGQDETYLNESNVYEESITIGGEDGLRLMIE